jgi:hypothetical protein
MVVMRHKFSPVCVSGVFGDFQQQPWHVAMATQVDRILDGPPQYRATISRVKTQCSDFIGCTWKCPLLNAIFFWKSGLSLG